MGTHDPNDRCGHIAWPAHGLRRCRRGRNGLQASNVTSHPCSTCSSMVKRKVAQYRRLPSGACAPSLPVAPDHRCLASHCRYPNSPQIAKCVSAGRSPSRTGQRYNSVIRGRRKVADARRKHQRKSFVEPLQSNVYVIDSVTVCVDGRERLLRLAEAHQNRVAFLEPPVGRAPLPYCVENFGWEVRTDRQVAVVLTYLTQECSSVIPGGTLMEATLARSNATASVSLRSSSRTCRRASTSQSYALSGRRSDVGPHRQCRTATGRLRHLPKPPIAI